MVAVTDEHGLQRSDQTTQYATDSSVYHHSLVTEDSHALKFNAAASLQLLHTIAEQKNPSQPPAAPTDTRLIISPYNDDLHLLDLTTLDTPNRLLAKALTSLKPTRDDYATADYTESFNWSSVLETLRELAAAEGYEWERQSFYVVVFRSKLQPTAEISYLHDLDFHSLAEATLSGGLLKYWFGSKDEKFQNLATCTLFPPLPVCGYLTDMYVCQAYGEIGKMHDLAGWAPGTKRPDARHVNYTSPLGL